MTAANSNSALLTLVDSIDPVNAIISDVLQYLGQAPTAWGRYFTTTGSAEFRHRTEGPILHQHNIKLLPIARHTNHVGGSKALGIQDAQQGVGDLLATYHPDEWTAQGNEFLFFLDVEGNNSGPNGSISQEYYEGWSETLVSESRARTNGALTFLPAVYANHHDQTTFSILINSGLACHALWIARYHGQPEKFPAWDEAFAVPTEVQNSPLNNIVYLRQYAGGYQIGQQVDLDQTNPNIEDLQEKFLDRLILPPVQS